MAPPPALKPDDPTLLPSDDEDSDFELPAGGGDDSDDSGSDSDDERPSKRAKVAVVEEPVLTKAAVDDLWASFNSGADEDPYASTSKAAAPTAPKPKKIKITVTYQFVGETVTQEKEVLEDSKEAQDWLAKQKALGLPTTPSSASVSAPSATAPPPPTASTSAIDALFGTEDSTTADIPPIASTSAPTSIAEPPAPVAPSPAPAPKPAPGPKKKKGGGLGALAASLGKPAKLNTLEKSKLDWNKFVDKEDLSDTLTHARKDGYLDKQDFLGRTEQAREDAWEKNKAGRRGR